MGITPFKNSLNKLNVQLCIPQMIVILLVVLLYWLGIVMTFVVDRSKNYSLSVIANWIQILANSVALTTAMIYPLRKGVTVNSIIKSFEKVDAELSYLKIEHNYASDTKKYLILLLSWFTLLFSTTVFDLVVSLYILDSLRVWYWIVTILPIIIYTFALSQVYVIVGFLRQRCQLINEVILEFQNSDRNSVVAKNIIVVSIFNEKQPTISLSELFSKLFIALNELCELSLHVEDLYGPLLLTSFGAIFAVTSIQLFYCYLVIISPNTFSDISWPLVQTINIIIINLMVVIGITSVCEGVLIEVGEYFPLNYKFVFKIVFAGKKNITIPNKTTHETR